MITRCRAITVAMVLTVACLGGNVRAETVDSRGPILNRGMRVTVSPGSIQAPAYNFKNQCQKPGAWSADWIWLNPSAVSGANATVAGLFRKEITLKAAPKSVHAWISADTIYRVYINGKLAARGPADIGKDYDREQQGPRWMYDYRDLTGYFRSGVNVVAAEVFTQDFYTSRVTRGKHALLFEAQLDIPGAPPVTLKSDETWRGAPDVCWQNGGEYDANREIVGWRIAGFNNNLWPTCSRLKSIWTPLVASELPPLMEARFPIVSASIDGRPIKVNSGRLMHTRINGPCTMAFKYDRVFAGYPTFKINGINGATVRIIPGELERQQSRTITIKLRDGIQEFEYPVIDSFTTIRLEFTNVTRPVELLDVGANFSSFPVQYAGSFSCSNNHLNDLWNSSRWLTQICMQTHHLDSPNHQEPICDPGDYLIESHANYYAFGATWLARQDLRKFGRMLADLNYRNFHTSYSLLWLQMLINYYDYTGDSSLVKELAPQVFGLLDTFESWRGKNGLVSEAPNYMFMDWVTIAGFECHHPPAVIGQGYMTAFYYRALLDGIRVATLMNDTPLAENYAARRRQISQSFNRELWDAAAGLYRDGRPFASSVPPSQWLPADRQIETFSPHVNTLAVLYDLAPPDRQSAIMDTVCSTPQLNVQPYFTYFVLEALKHCNTYEQHSPALFARWHIEAYTQTYHEMWSSGDLSHAWGSAPLIQMSSTVVGVRPLTPRFQRFSIAPTIAGLTWARGAVPTPHGPVTVAWRIEGDRFWIEASVPRGTVAEFQPPEQAAGTGSPTVWAAGKHSAVYVLQHAAQP